MNHTPLVLSTKAFLRKAYRPFEVVQEAWLAARAPHNPELFASLYRTAQQKAREPRLGFSAYLRDYPPIGEIAIATDWSHDQHEYLRLHYSSTLFGEGTIRARIDGESQHVLIFLPGYYVGAEKVLRDTSHPQYLVDLASDLKFSLVTWTWPLQENRGDRGLFSGMKSTVSIEREYARILPTFGTSLWREMVAELDFALSNIARLFDRGQTLHIVGWSMGGAFAYFAPLLCSRVQKVVSAGSCARIIDLLQTARTRVHSFYFYPHDSLRYFDLDDIVAEVLGKDVELHIIYGEHDQGCLETSSNALIARAAENRGLALRILPSHGHHFSTELKRCIADSLTSFINSRCMPRRQTGC